MLFITSAPLVFDSGTLGLGGTGRERVRWRKDGTSLTPGPAAGDLVAAHWDWVCAAITAAERDALAEATQRTLDFVNEARSNSKE